MRLGGYTLRELGRHRGRTLLTVAGVVIGVGALVSVGITLQTTRGAHRSLLESAGDALKGLFGGDDDEEK